MGKKTASTTEKVSNITTNTTTTIRDVGVTGKDAVELVNVLESGSIGRTQINADLLKTIVQSTGATLQQLVGGATDVSNRLVETGERAGGQIIKASAKEALAAKSDIIAIAPWIAIAVAIFAVAPVLRGK